MSERLVSDVRAAKAEFSERHFRAAREGRHWIWAAARRVGDAIARATTHVHSIGVGRKLVDDKPTDALCVRVYVTQKLPKKLLPQSARIPSSVAGIPTDVIESPPAFLAIAPPCSLRKTRGQRPLCPGISAANAAVNAGTIAALCRSTRAGEEARRFLLGNSHTFADLGAAAPGSAILQPSPHDGGTAADQVATLSRFVSIDERVTAVNLVDAAIAELTVPAAAMADICGIGAPRGLGQAVLRGAVQKHGRSTGFTAGVIEDPDVDLVLPLSRSHPDRVARFVRQIRIRPAAGVSVFAQGGDSGALVTTRPHNKAIGLLFACPDNGSFAIANPIDEVLRQLEIDFAS
jgi:hypothetical protein